MFIVYWLLVIEIVVMIYSLLVIEIVVMVYSLLVIEIMVMVYSLLVIEITINYQLSIIHYPLSILNLIQRSHRLLQFHLTQFQVNLGINLFRLRLQPSRLSFQHRGGGNHPLLETQVGSA